MSYPNLTPDIISVITEFFNWVDTDHNGCISIEEIKTACAVDINNDSVISEDERVTCAKPWIEVYLQQQDLDNNQQITLHELLQFNNSSHINN